MKAENITGIFAFTGNPIILNDSRNHSAGVPGSFSVRLGGKELFEGRFTPPVSINVADLAASACPEIPEVSDNNDKPVVCLESARHFLTSRRLDVSINYNNSVDTFECIALPGGISNQNFEYFAKKGSDVFESRLLDYKGNFFLTTRTDSWRIVMKETEVCPLYFLSSGPHRLAACEKVTGMTIYLDNIESGLYALDVDVMRRRFFEYSDILPSLFDIIVDGVPACRIVLSLSELSKNRCLIKFRNSFGVFDRLELTGEINEIWGFDEGSEGFMRYNPVTDDFDFGRERMTSINTLSIKTGVKYPHELTAIHDMLLSDETWILTDDIKQRVIISAEDIELKKRADSPFEILLKLRFIGSERLVSPIMHEKEGWVRPGIFTDVFSKQFN